jgi:hypothetical protein
MSDNLAVDPDELRSASPTRRQLRQRNSLRYQLRLDGADRDRQTGRGGDYAVGL